MLNAGAPDRPAAMAATLLKLVVTDFAFMVNRALPRGTSVALRRNPGSAAAKFKFDQTSQERSDACIEGMKAAGIRTHLIVWMSGIPAFIKSLVADFLPYAAASGATSIICDAEVDWQRASGVDALVEDLLIPGLEPFPKPVHWDSYPTPHKTDLRIAAYCIKERGALNGFALPQCYTHLRQENGTVTEPTRRYATPDKYPARGIRQWRRIVGDRVIPIVSVFGDPYPGWTASNALAAGLNQAAKAATPAVGIWSARAILNMGTGQLLNDTDTRDVAKVLGRFQASGGYVDYKHVVYRARERGDLSRNRQQEAEDEAKDAERRARLLALGGARSDHNFESSVVPGLRYDFAAGRWV